MTSPRPQALPQAAPGLMGASARQVHLETQSVGAAEAGFPAVPWTVVL